jgi:hypothetical protein
VVVMVQIVMLSLAGAEFIKILNKLSQ